MGLMDCIIPCQRGDARTFWIAKWTRWCPLSPATCLQGMYYHTLVPSRCRTLKRSARNVCSYKCSARIWGNVTVMGEMAVIPLIAKLFLVLTSSSNTSHVAIFGAFDRTLVCGIYTFFSCLNNNVLNKSQQYTTINVPSTDSRCVAGER